MKEIISIHIGEAGTNVGSNCWEMYCLEHGIDNRDGSVSLPTPKDENDNQVVGRRKIFSERVDGTYQAKALFVDLDSENIDRIRSRANNHQGGGGGGLFHEDNLESGGNDLQLTGCNFARGRGVCGNGGGLVLENCMDRIKKMVEECESLDGFLITSSLNGGTGSGFREVLMERLAEEYSFKKPRISFDILSSPGLSSSNVEPYNVVFGLNSVRKYSDVSVLYENEALYDICKNKLGIESPKKADVNEILTHTISSATISVRTDGYLHSTLNDITSNLIPYPTVKYIMNSISPLYPKWSSIRQPISDITMECFLGPQLLNQCSFVDGKFMNSVIQFRGEVSPKDVGIALGVVKTSSLIRFVDWTPKGFKCGLSYSPIPQLSNISLGNQTAYMMSNNTVVTKLFSRIENNFDKMFSERAFVHWFLNEGMEEGEIADLREEIRQTQFDYVEIEREFEDEEEDI